MIQGLQQNNVPDEGHGLRDRVRPGASSTSRPPKSLTAHDLFQTAYKPVELGGKAVKTFQQNLKKYGGFTGVPGFGEYTGLRVLRPRDRRAADGREEPDPSGLGRRRSATPTAASTTTPVSPAARGTSAKRTSARWSTTSCLWYAWSRTGSGRSSYGGKPVMGKLVGDPALIKQYQSNAGTGVTTTSAAPASSSNLADPSRLLGARPPAGRTGAPRSPRGGDLCQRTESAPAARRWHRRRTRSTRPRRRRRGTRPAAGGAGSDPRAGRSAVRARASPTRRARTPRGRRAGRARSHRGRCRPKKSADRWVRQWTACSSESAPSSRAQCVMRWRFEPAPQNIVRCAPASVPPISA